MRFKSSVEERKITSYSLPKNRKLSYLRHLEATQGGWKRTSIGAAGSWVVTKIRLGGIPLEAVLHCPRRCCGWHRETRDGRSGFSAIRDEARCDWSAERLRFRTSGQSKENIRSIPDAQWTQERRSCLKTSQRTGYPSPRLANFPAVADAGRTVGRFLAGKVCRYPAPKSPERIVTGLERWRKFRRGRRRPS